MSAILEYKKNNRKITEAVIRDKLIMNKVGEGKQVPSENTICRRIRQQDQNVSQPSYLCNSNNTGALKVSVCNSLLESFEQTLPPVNRTITEDIGVARKHKQASARPVSIEGYTRFYL